VRWTGSDDEEVGVTDEFDVEPGGDEDDGPPAESVTEADTTAIGIRAPESEPVEEQG